MSKIQDGFFRNKTAFVPIPQVIAKDKELSLKAKGLYLLIQSYITIPNFKLYKSYLMSVCIEGQCSFDSAWNELKNKGYKVGLLSNLRLMDYKRYEEQIKKINFDYLFLSYEIKCIKPSNDIYLQVINALNCEADNIIFFDDNQKNVNGAKQLGINAYQVTGENIKEIFYKIINI